MKFVPLRLLVIVVVAATACQKAPTTTTAEGTFRAFHDAVKRHDAKAAFSLLAPTSRDALAARSRALAEASKGTVKDEPALMAFRTPRRAADLISITLAEAQEGRAVLVVKTCGLPLGPAGACPPGADVQERVTMVRDAERWGVELPVPGTP